VPHEYLDLMDKTLNNYVFTLINIQIAIQKIKNIIHFKNLLYVWLMKFHAFSIIGLD